MESIEVNDQMYDEIQGTNDLEMVDHISKKRKKKLEKKIAAGKFKGKKLARKQAIVSGKKQTTFGKILKVATGGASALGSKAGRTSLKQDAKKIAGATVLLPLQPLRPVMMKGLQKEGVSVSSKTPLVDIANLYYNKVVRKHDSSLEECDINNFEDNVIGEAIGVVVKGIIAFIKGVKKKKKAGVPLTKTEEEINTTVEKIESKVIEPAQEQASEMAQTEVEQKIGGFVFDNKIIILIVIAAVVFFLIRKK
jgi:hypothetical protein